MIPRFRAKRVAIVGSLAVALAAISLVVSVLVGPLAGTREAVSPSAEAYSVRGAEKLKMAYADWVKQHDVNGGDRNVTISLGYWKALSAEYTRASGLAKLDLIDGSVSVTVSGLPPGQQWDVWLVDNRPGPRQSVKPEPSDAMVRVGRLVSAGDTATLDARLGRAAFQQFHVDMVVVARAGSDPGTTGLLFGAPALFQRLYTARRSEELLRQSDFAHHPGVEMNRRSASLLSVSAAEATGEARSLTDGAIGERTGILVNEDVLFSDLVARGAHLFLNERFKGNGRTCATCHRKDANFTIDVNFIAALPDDDALFVAEFTPALAFTPSGKKFEVPVLMRKHGLIVENQDGMGDLVNRFNMRGVPHTLGMRQSLTPANDGITRPPNQRTGWSGDGAPGNGTLREFATGAVTQHFTKTLTREPGVDFRLPNDAELDAMEAFQLTLGRQVDLVLPLNLKDPQVARGQALFIADPDDPDPSKRGGGCNACHSNAGANASFGGGGNRNFNTGVENQRDRPQVLTLQAHNIDLTPGVGTNIIPRDGGFGQTPGEGPDQSGFGNSTFNTVSVVEAADSGPFFHDSSVATIEGAVEFYNSQEFANARNNGVRLNLAATQVEAIAAFLRAINALDNIREATEIATAARTVAINRPRVADELIRQAIAEATDAMSVLFARGLHTNAVKALEEAIRHFTRASTGGQLPRIDRALIDRGLAKLARARADVVQ